MYINKLFSNFIKKISNKENNNNYILLENNISKFTYIACAISSENIEILESKDNLGGYLNNKLLLPKKISISKDKNINYLIYIYIIVFLLTSKKFNFYLPKKDNNIDYILLATLLTIKDIHKNLFLNFPAIKNMINILYPVINKKRKIINKNSKSLIFEILIKKLSYIPLCKNIKIKLSKEEKHLIYQIENTKIETFINYKQKIIYFYNIFNNMYSNNNNIILNPLWGYLYFNSNTNINISNKKNIPQKILNETQRDIKNIEIEESNIEKDKKKNTPFSSVVEHMKTVEEYNGGNKKIDGENENKDLSILNELNIKKTTKTNIPSNSIFSSNIINNISISEVKDTEVINIKKILYDEWDYKKRKYYKNWCSVYEKKNKSLNKNIEYIEKILLNNKKNINFLKEKLKFIISEKTWKKRQLHGEDIDFDSVIDNYENIIKSFYEKIYKFQKPKYNDLSISILLDSSLSTDSYSNNKKIINIIKEISIIICSSINNLIKYFSISSFYSNTRLDCKYIIIKNFNDDWDKKKYNTDLIFPNGYTRIGPALRHATNSIKKLKTKKKLILLISDGKPTDYDEYEGEYGINDVKHAIIEANKLKIEVKSLIIDDVPRPYFTSMLGINNYQLIKDNTRPEIEILKILYDTIKN